MVARPSLWTYSGRTLRKNSNKNYRASPVFLKHFHFPVYFIHCIQCIKYCIQYKILYTEGYRKQVFFACVRACLCVCVKMLFLFFYFFFKFLAASEDFKLWSTEEWLWLGRRKRAPSPVSPRQDGLSEPSPGLRSRRSPWCPLVYLKSFNDAGWRSNALFRHLRVHQGERLKRSPARVALAGPGHWWGYRWTTHTSNG